MISESTAAQSKRYMSVYEKNLWWWIYIKFQDYKIIANYVMKINETAAYAKSNDKRVPSIFWSSYLRYRSASSHEMDMMMDMML